jgi:ribosomal protein L11 methyltransferase
MKQLKPLWKVSVSTTLEAEEAVVEMLSGFFDSSASSYFDFKKKTSLITVFTSGKIQPTTLQKLRIELKTIRDCGLDIGSGKVSAHKVRREDWAESWKRHFQPIEIGRALLVKPDWSKRRPRTAQAIVVLNPGLSFGTGQHPTTLFCLEEIARTVNKALEAKRPAASHKSRLSFFDIGTGSGILAIAAAKLGCEPVCAIDFDPEAIRAARTNAQVNGVEINLYSADVTKLSTRPKQRFNLICANLISGLLVKERNRIVTHLKPGGILVLAGILKSEFSEVQRSFEKSGLKLIRARTKKEWRSGSFYRR